MRDGKKREGIERKIDRGGGRGMGREVEDGLYGMG
jgi:hypothetical protein